MNQEDCGSDRRSIRTPPVQESNARRYAPVWRLLVLLILACVAGIAFSQKSVQRVGGMLNPSWLNTRWESAPESECYLELTDFAADGIRGVHEDGLLSDGWQEDRVIHLSVAAALRLVGTYVLSAAFLAAVAGCAGILLHPAGRTLPACLVGVALLSASGRAQKLGGSMLQQVLGSGSREFIENLEQLRPPAVSTELRAQILSSLPKEGQVKVLNESQRRKLDSLDTVLRAHGRQVVYEVMVIEVRQAFVGLYERTVVLLSTKSLDLLAAKELQALVAHEIGHEYVWRQHESASSRKDYGLLRQLELYCDGVAIATLHRIGVDPVNLFAAVRKVSAYNRMRFGMALNEQAYPTLASRKAFARSMIESITAGADAGPLSR